MAPNPESKRVLSMLNRDGSRYWIRPRVAPGRFLFWRRIVAYSLIALFIALPFLRINGRPAFLIDVRAAELSLFGTVFRPSDSFLLMLLGLTIVLTVLLVTALFGRVWCGWGCPQTVYLEHIFRPIERLIEGPVSKQRAMDKAGKPNARRMLTWVVIFVLSFFVANIFLSYFVGTKQLITWITSSPAKHPGGFAVVAVVTGLMFFDFGYMRENVCIIACPYGRLQSALIDKASLIVAYDDKRGEPRSAKKKKLPVINDAEKKGDCVDCGACVAVCPTGIDIRNGLQMECVGCAQCIDACDTVMDKLELPRGLVRYTSQDELAGKKRKTLRPRTILYPMLLAVAVGMLIYRSNVRPTNEVWVLRPEGPEFVRLPDGKVAASARIKVENKSETVREYSFELVNATDAALRSPLPVWKVQPHKSIEVPLFIDVPATSFKRGQRTIALDVKLNGQPFSRVTVGINGPEQ